MFKIFICTFNLSNQRLRRYTSGIIYAGSYGKTIFHFNFNTPDWDISPTKTAVFSYRGKNYHEPLDENNMCRVPEEVLYEGYFLVSVQDGLGLITNSIRVPVAPMPTDIAPDTNEIVEVVSALSARVEELDKTKADNVIFDPQAGTIQLLANDELIGDCCEIPVGEGEPVVFVPSIDDDKILTFTNNGNLPNPAPVDLNPFDEWSTLPEEGVATEYEWEYL